jgi:hypothetical protein
MASTGYLMWKATNRGGRSSIPIRGASFPIDLAEVRTAEGKLYLFVAIVRTSKSAVVEPVEKADMRAAAAFLQALIEAVPYRIHTVLSDNGIQLAYLPRSAKG